MFFWPRHTLCFLHASLRPWLVTCCTFLSASTTSPITMQNKYSMGGARLSIHCVTIDFTIKIFVEEQNVPHYQLTCHILGPARAKDQSPLRSPAPTQYVVFKCKVFQKYHKISAKAMLCRYLTPIMGSSLQ